MLLQELQMFLLEPYLLILAVNQVTPLAIEQTSLLVDVIAL